MKYNFKRTFDAVNIQPERQKQIRSMLSSRITEKQEYNMSRIYANTTIHRRRKKTAAILIAVALLVLLLTGAAFAIYFLSLRDLVIPEPGTVTTSQDTGSQVTGSQDADAQDTGSQNYKSQSISLQGYVGSNEYAAAVEWLAFRDNYDKDRTILNQIGNSDTGLGDAYEIYGAYTQEMADKLDEIAAKYGLSLHGEPINTPMEDSVEDFIELVAYGNFLGDTNTAAYPGLVYEDGTFFFEGYIGDYEPEHSISVDFKWQVIMYDPSLHTPEEAYGPSHIDDGTLVIIVPFGGSAKDVVIPDISTGELTFVPYNGDLPIDEVLDSVYAGMGIDDPRVGFQYRYCKKGSLDDVIVGIGDIEKHTTWSYTTACGTTVTLSQSPYQSLVIADLSEAFVTINIVEGSASFAASELEAFADTIDFTLLK